ncbi:MAG: YggS family pyridoxal phosphate-dependent enzyme [Candidatus Omnitrophica bacterium]|nr:YggS family pyridoxal phosphate-dependent enzyme [Candidatus Omnitrophota bacterium]
MKNTVITNNVKELLAVLPADVELVAAAKARSTEEILEAVSAGVKVIGENYIQEAEAALKEIGHGVRWHFIGHLQKNKVKKAAELFDMIETLDDVTTAEALNRNCANIGKVMPVLVEVNSGREAQKSGVFPEKVLEFVKTISGLSNISVKGLMTMGPFSGDPEEARPFFKETKKIFDILKKAHLANVEMRYLSMGMTNSYKVAIEEGANVVRIGTRIFGERD